MRLQAEQDIHATPAEVFRFVATDHSRTTRSGILRSAR